LHVSYFFRSSILKFFEEDKFMGTKAPSIGLKATLVIFILTLLAMPAWATGFRILHNFNDQQGRQPHVVILGADGNIYGITVLGGPNGSDGTVYELTPDPAGGWRETKVFGFSRQGIYPNPVIFDAEGNLYGTSELGPDGGCGAVFELSLNAAGHWDETILHNLSCDEGLYPESALVRDSSGNYYGTAWGGGAYGKGTVFELSPMASGGWIFQVLHSFSGSDGVAPQTSVAIDAGGNLYGTALCGGSSAAVRSWELTPDCGGAPGDGTVWELSPQSDGSWTETTIYNFTGGSDGANPSPEGPLIFDAAGNLYGGTNNGGQYGKGTVYELSPTGDGTWTEKVLHSFDGSDGISPSGGVIADAAGNLYGETFGPGSYAGVGCGGESIGQLVYKLTSSSDGTWSETVLHRFDDPVCGGPAMGLVFDAGGNLYGTTYYGGTYNNGTVFEITP
jgi:uncharacterized repeat protein (TIGR03803 family)